MTEKKKNFLLLLTSIALSLFLIETICSTIFSSKVNKINFTKEPGYFLFEQGDVFINADKIFKYHSNKNILTKSYVYLDNEFKEAYSYEIETNNFGLAQKNDLKKNTPSILFLGDSFTEGQGETPWINKFDGKFKDYQVIGGGILATGPQQFAYMEDHVSKNYNIQKVFLLYIGHDVRRSPFTISNQQINCLKDYNSCKGNEMFFGFPLKSENPNNFLNNLREQRIKTYNNLSLKKKVKKKIKGFFLDLYIFKIPSTFLKEKFYKSNNVKIRKNFAAIKKLNDKYGDNIYFVNLRTWHETLNRKEYETNLTEKFIQKISKNHYICDFEKNLEFFSSLHFHPNKKGYDYLFKCISQIMETEIK